jgi:hypothetical protein
VNRMPRFRDIERVISRNQVGMHTIGPISRVGLPGMIVLRETTC